MKNKLNKISFYCVDDQLSPDRGANYFKYNLAEYWVQEFKHYGVESKAAKCWATAMNMALSSGCKWALFFRPGNQFFKDNEFLRTIVDDMNDETLCLAHVLDRFDQYLEIHPQCFLLNIDLYRKMGAPSFVKTNVNSCLQNFDRSEENFHDSYTPVWIEAKNGTSHFNRVCTGSLIISEGLARGYKIKPFSRVQRNAKFYLYDKNDYLESFSELKQICDLAQRGFYCSNTETYKSNNSIGKPLENLVIPPSGLFPFKLLKDMDYLRKKECVKMTSITFYDISRLSLDIYKEMFNSWNGRNYVDFIHEQNQKPNVAIKQLSVVESTWGNFIDEFGGQASWLQWFDELKKECRIQYKELNLLNRKLFKQEFFRTPVHGLSLFWMTNIFHYLPTHLYFSHAQLIGHLNKIIDHFKKNNPHWFLKFNITAGLPSKFNSQFEESYKIQSIQPDTFPWNEPNANK